MDRGGSQRPGLVVVGASLAGLRAVQAARRNGYDGLITLVGAERYLPYDRPPLSKEFLTKGCEPVFYLSEQVLRHDLAVDLRLGQAATRLDTAGCTVAVGHERIPYDRLIIATGARPRTLPLADLRGVHALRGLDDARAIREAISLRSRLVIVGGGFIGAEIASAARSLGASATIIEAAPVPLVRAVGEMAGRALGDLHERNGTRLLCGVQIDRITGVRQVEHVRLTTGETLPADLVVVGIGAVPATEWLSGSGVALSAADGGVLCDEYLRTTIPGVYAGGDVAHWLNPTLGASMRLENWTNASDQGSRAAVNALFPEQACPYGTVPYFWSDWYGNRIQFVGTAVADSVGFASGAADAEHFVALYQSRGRLVGAVTLNQPRVTMKLRRLIGDLGTLEDAQSLLKALS